MLCQSLGCGCGWVYVVCCQCCLIGLQCCLFGFLFGFFGICFVFLLGVFVVVCFVILFLFYFVVKDCVVEVVEYCMGYVFCYDLFVFFQFVDCVVYVCYLMGNFFLFEFQLYQVIFEGDYVVVLIG